MMQTEFFQFKNQASVKKTLLQYFVLQFVRAEHLDLA